jgi:succinyl-diaminopimelate desuccinylase
MQLAQTKNAIIGEIDRRRDELVNLCSRLIQIPSENPPGDTGRIAEFVKEYLNGKGLGLETYTPKKGLTSIVSENGVPGGRSIVLNGHLDIFPAGTEGWDFSPFCGDVKDGKILGRGATDMKAGVAASLFAYAIIQELKVKLTGKIVLSLVADEESGGRWGTDWLLDNVPALTGDACLIAEPGGLDSVVFGEKGRCQFRVKAKGIAGHSPMPLHSVNAIVKMARVIPALDTLKDLEVRTPEELTALIQECKADYDKYLGDGAGRVLDHLTVNVGTIRGGTNINTVPDLCEVDVDVTLPFGITPQEAKREFDSRLNSVDADGVECEFIQEYPFHRPALYTPISERIVKVVTVNVRAITAIEPRYVIKHWGTDGKFFRKRGIPTVIYGTSEMTAAPNEHVIVDELIKVTKVHACAIVDFLFR